MKASFAALFVATLVVIGCGNSGSSAPPGSAPNNPDGGASGTSTSSGGTSPSSGGASGVEQTGATGNDTSTGGGPINGAGAGGVTSSNAGNGSSSGGTVGMAGNGVMGTANAPSVTFTEYAIPTNTGAPDSNPGEIAEGPDGNIWFNHQSTAPNAIQNISPTGTFSAVFKTSTTNIGPVAVTGGPDGNVYYTKQGGVGQAQPSGAVKEFGVPNGGDSGGITKGPDGKVWFTEPTKNMIGNMTTAGQFKTFPIPTANSTPFAITTGPDMNLWFTESGTAGNKIGKITTAGVITEYPIATPAANPQSITSGPDGNLWFTELDGHKLGKVTPAGVVTEYGLPSAASPGDIVAGKDGNLWFAEAGTANSIARATPDGSVAEYQIPTAAAEPTGMAPGSDGNIWFSELGTNKIGRVSNLTGGGTVKATTGMSGGDAPLTDGLVCTNDTDCVDSGKACGGDVCSFKVTPHVCVLATSGDPGWCSADAKCWCNSEGATCDMTTHACSFVLHGGGTK